jgi:hypothetical protein
MTSRYVEGKSGSRVISPRCGASSSCSPLWRRYRHDCSLGNAWPWRRLYNGPERAWTGPDPSNGICSGARPAGGFGRGLRSVGPVAPPQGRYGLSVRSSGATGISSAGRRSLRACAGPRPDRRLYLTGHVTGECSAVCRDQSSAALAKHPAAGGPGPGSMGYSHAFDSSANGGPITGRQEYQDKQPASSNRYQGPSHRPAGGRALPSHPSPGQQAEHRGAES